MNGQELLLEYDQLIKLTEGQSSNNKIKKFRDLSIIDLIGDVSLVVACDSNASNGEKPNDSHKNTYEETAISALKVPLMEVLASGATPVVIANNLCVEMEPVGKRIISIMKKELEESNLWDKLSFTGSTEDNMKTLQTGIGVTVIGLLNKKSSKLGNTKNGDCVMCVGLPQSGILVPYSEKDSNVCKIKTVKELSEKDYIHEILPIGSKGAAYEAGELARMSNLSFEVDNKSNIDLETSAGSCTSVLISLSPEDEKRLINEIDIPVYYIGRLKK